MSVHDANYKKIKKECGIPEDEPIFILRAQDKLALPTIQRYVNHANGIEIESEQRSHEWFDGMDEVLREFTTWQQGNKDQLKLPD